MGQCEAEEVARLAERNERELRPAVHDGLPTVERKTPLRELLPLFIDDADAPVAVVDEQDRLEGAVVRGALISGLTTYSDASEDDGEGLDAVDAPETGENDDRVRVHRAGE